MSNKHPKTKSPKDHAGDGAEMVAPPLDPLLAAQLAEVKAAVQVGEVTMTDLRRANLQSQDALSLALVKRVIKGGTKLPGLIQRLHRCLVRIRALRIEAAVCSAIDVGEVTIKGLAAAATVLSDDDGGQITPRRLATHLNKRGDTMTYPQLVELMDALVRMRRRRETACRNARHAAAAAARIVQRGARIAGGGL